MVGGCGTTAESKKRARKHWKTSVSKKVLKDLMGERREDRFMGFYCSARKMSQYYASQVSLGRVISMWMRKRSSVIAGELRAKEMLKFREDGKAI